MTEDTRVMLEAIKSIAEHYNLTVTADNRVLTIDDGFSKPVKIGIACNSTLATMNEFIGYLFVKYWLWHCRYRLGNQFTMEDLIDAIQRYWVKEDSISEGTRRK